MGMTKNPIRAAREDAGLSRSQLAAKSGVTSETIERIELRKNDPSMATLRALADALCLPVAALIDERVTSSPDVA